MISHTIPAAGVAGLIKVALALYHRVLPPTLHCDEPNPKLGLERTPFYVNTETRPWIHGGAGAAPRRRQRLRLRRHQRPRGARGVRRRARRATTGRRGRASCACSRATRRPGSRAAGRAGWPPSLDTAGPACASPTSPSRSAAALGGAERPLRLAIVAELGGRPAREARTGDREARARRAAGGSRRSQGSTTRPSRSGATARSSSSSRARARSTRTCWPTSACTSPRCARCSIGSTGSTPSIRAATS